jgi:hypothetical protein
MHKHLRNQIEKVKDYQYYFLPPINRLEERYAVIIKIIAPSMKHPIKKPFSNPIIPSSQR